MAKKRTTKAKEPIKLRFRKLLHGNQSIYLDIYFRGDRRTETLPFKLIPEVDDASRLHNRNIIQRATAIKSQRILELMSEESGLPKSLHRSKLPLLEWMSIFKERKEKGFREGINSTIKHLTAYGANVTMGNVNRDYVRGFIAYLKSTDLSPRSQRHYLCCLSCAMSAAVRDEVIAENPFNRIGSDERVKVKDSIREYLTIDELKLLIDAPCRNEYVKRAYLFACFCGLRLSDVTSLQWGDLQKDGEIYKIGVVMNKTGRTIYMKLSQQALKWLPQRGYRDDKVPIFDLPHKSTSNRILKDWASSVGIKKNITFHTSRHTFATGEYTAGADLYTIQNLLGHTNIKTTQIYAKIIDKKKEEAVDMWSKIFD